VVLDGEIVALDPAGEPSRFQHLQGRMHVKTAASAEAQAVALVVFDLLRDGRDDLRGQPLSERRRRLESLMAGWQDPRLRLSEITIGDGRALLDRAEAAGWEGLIAKRLRSTYDAGRRSSDWCKLKLIRHQTCVVGGWTEPRGSRARLGALLLGVYDGHGRLVPVGHSGSGFTDAELERVWTRLVAIESDTCPFATVPKTNERPHWVRPTLVAEVKFTEWTTDGQLRHPTYLGLRDDIAPARVRREPDAGARPTRAKPSTPARRTKPAGPVAAPAAAADETTRRLLSQIDAIEHESRTGSGTLHLPSGDRLAVTNLGKVFWPAAGLTKGDLFRHYVRVASCILPVVADRPLVMKRFPNGVDGKPFYQQRAPEKAPDGVRIERITDGEESMPRVVGGTLVTLLYLAQLATISQDPWLSRVQSPDEVDHVAIDLDPPDDLPFARVLDVARWVGETLAQLKVPAFPKLSGAGGLHIFIPMPPGTSYEAGQLFCQIVATLVETRHPKAATTERAIKARAGRVYLDYLQNHRGKTLACAYSARASAFAGVSAPVTWREIDAGVRPQDVTVRNFDHRLAAVGDLWAGLRAAKGVDLRAVLKAK
jgi:bifunctional non-homologous end joining protein LigD